MFLKYSVLQDQAVLLNRISEDHSDWKMIDLFPFLACKILEIQLVTDKIKHTQMQSK